MDPQAAVDAHGRVRLWRYPVAAKGAVPRDSYAHAAPGGSIAWSADGTRLFSTSRGDGCLAVWSLEADTLPPDEATVAPDDDGVDRCEYACGRALDGDPAVERAAQFDQGAIFRMEEKGRDEDYAPLLPWQRTVVAPSRPPTEDLSLPSDRLELEWVHGARCHDIRGAVRYTAARDGAREIVYAAARLLVCLAPGPRAQRYFTEHPADVVGVATHPETGVVATGDARVRPAVMVWDIGSLACRACLRGHHRRAVPLLAFSPAQGGRYLATVGCDDLHRAVVYDWAVGAVAAVTPTHQEKPLALVFNRAGAGFGGGVGFALGGRGVLAVWTCTGQSAAREPVRLGSRGSVQATLCLAWQGSSLVAGQADGSLYRFSGRMLDRVVTAHQGAVNDVCAAVDGLCTGGADGLVKLWNLQLECILDVDLALLGSLDAHVRAVDWDSDRGRVAVGTRGAEVWELDATEGRSLHAGGALCCGHFGGHFGGELWALDAHPTLPQFATAGDDRMLRIWSLFDRRQVRCAQLEMMARALAYDPEGQRFAVGFGAPVPTATKQFDGKIVIMSADDFAVVHEARDSQKHITELKCAQRGPQFLRYHNQRVCRSIRDCFSGKGGVNALGATTFPFQGTRLVVTFWLPAHTTIACTSML